MIGSVRASEPVKLVTKPSRQLQGGHINETG
jgi:hypothetical protein